MIPRRAGRLVVAMAAAMFASPPLLCPPAGRCVAPICGTMSIGGSHPGEKTKKVRRKVDRDAVADQWTPIRQVLHIGRYLAMWKEKWVGPANLDRASLRVTGMDTYALVAAVLLQVITGLYGSVPEPDNTDERIKYPALQRFMYEAQMFLAAVSTVCSTYTMVMFLLCKIYTVMALGMYKDVSYDLFQQATARFRLRAFWSLIIAMHSFLVSFAMNLFTRIKGRRGIVLCLLTMMGITPVIWDWKIIYEVAEQYVYK